MMFLTTLTAVKFHRTFVHTGNLSKAAKDFAGIDLVMTILLPFSFADTVKIGEHAKVGSKSPRTFMK